MRTEYEDLMRRSERFERLAVKADSIDARETFLKAAKSLEKKARVLSIEEGGRKI